MSSHANSLFLRESGQRLGRMGCLQRLQDSMQQRALRTRLRLQTMTREHVLRFLRRNAFILLTISAVIIGVSLAFGLRPYQLTYRQIKYFSFPGELLMRMLQMLVLPLIVSSLVTGMASLDNKATGRMGMRAAVYYMVTTVIAVFIGILMVTIIHPGKGSKEGLHREGRIETIPTADAFMDLVRNMFPPNLVEACFKQFKTQYSTRLVTRTVVRTENGSEQSASMPPPSSMENGTSLLENVTRALGTLQEVLTFEEIVPVPGSANGINALGLVVFSVAFGLVIGGMKHKGRVLRDFFDSLNEAIMRLVGIIIWYAPVGILFLIAGKILEMEDMAVLGGQLGMYTLTVIVGLFLHAGGVLPLIYFLITHRNPFPFIGGMLQALITAMGTSSSPWGSLSQLCDTAHYLPLPGGGPGCGPPHHQVRAARGGHCQHGRHCPLRGPGSHLHCPSQQLRAQPGSDHNYQYHCHSGQRWGCWHSPGGSGHHGHCAHISRPAH
ncbi:PREDICTED: excitatory amino acid transporter 4 isoform X3 [Myotis davidii]|uniref:excitatory amino acid transporter 4 isoform X3 n=1 Tax=Myotis davidii TaxID=225400 RepID=UPI000767BF3F|nr:PREDICTED: excitatory amino acid transporter 4 isoform X3 [Myotis davidii]